MTKYTLSVFALAQTYTFKQIFLSLKLRCYLKKIIAYHKISGVGVPSAWQLRIIESPANRTENEIYVVKRGFTWFERQIRFSVSKVRARTHAHISIILSRFWLHVTTDTNRDTRTPKWCTQSSKIVVVCCRQIDWNSSYLATAPTS